ncbi:Selenide,water dikinase [Prochlorococcus marinus str. MIT 9515]|uniref:Selenide,water dikinase n=1 Tax=Prochlorococcus marinus (strain MIT 9515) TaxID=167542 RepID=A2BUT3_PROM5|nr:selenide, water dikinase SelD [Prochlorococcus marinus]ABM71544.1 Selenide,water dikinase [Prochlorococcus marinus str. MIT 9515]
MTINHLVLIGGGHTNVLLMRKWLMNPKLMPEIPISIISRDTDLVYSAMFPSVISKSISLNDSLIDIRSLAKKAKISFIQNEVLNIDFHLKKICLKNRPSIGYSKLVLNYGSQTKISGEFEDLVNNQIAFPIKPFFKAYELIKNEDKNDSEPEKPFIIVGSGLAAIEIAFALRKRWEKRSLKILCKTYKIDTKISKSLYRSNIELVKSLPVDYGKILLCTGNSSPLWVQSYNSELDSKGRFLTNQNLRLKNFSGIFATGDCAVIETSKRPSSGIFAVKALNILAANIQQDIKGKSLKRWYPQKIGLQIVNSYPRKIPKAFAFYGDVVFGPSFFLWYLKNKIDEGFIKKFRILEPKMNHKIREGEEMDCRGCAAKIPQNILNKSLRSAQLENFATSPEDAVQIYNNNQETILQSVDGFPALISDPWLNAKITVLHACSDLWACGAKLSSVQALISLPKVGKDFQSYLFTHCLKGIKTTVEEQGGELIGGHTFESRSLVDKPYSLGIDISLTVQGVLRNGAKPWFKSGMQKGDILLMSRPLGVGIFFAAQMQNINLKDSSEEIMKNLVKSQQPLIEQIYFLQDKFGETFINAATDITGYGFMGHLKEMIDSSNLSRKDNNLEPINVLLDLLAFKAYPGVFELIRKGVKSSLFESNKEIIDQILSEKPKNRIISFSKKNKVNSESFKEKISLLLDPQTCGPLLISCDPKYESFLNDEWYKVGEVIN